MFLKLKLKVAKKLTNKSNFFFKLLMFRWKRLVITTRKFWLSLKTDLWLKSCHSSMLFKIIFCKSKGLNFDFTMSLFRVFILNEIILTSLNSKTITKNTHYHLGWKFLVTTLSYLIIVCFPSFRNFLSWSHNFFYIFTVPLEKSSLTEYFVIFNL